MIFSLVLAGMAVWAQGDTTALLGNWDLTVHAPGKDFPSWLEVHTSGARFMVGRFVGGGGKCAADLQGESGEWENEFLDTAAMGARRS